MATKIYKLKQRKNTASFTLTGKLGNHVRYNFEHGNTMQQIPAKCVISNEYCQQLLENSDLYGSVVALERVVKEDKPQKVELTHVEDVTSVTQAVDYIANEWGVRVTTAKQAVREAEKHGFDFPNLKVGKQ
jgi:hypothetical protein